MATHVWAAKAVESGGTRGAKAPVSAAVGGLAYATWKGPTIIALVALFSLAFAGCAVLALVGLLISSPIIPDLPALTWLLLAGFAFFWLLGAGLLTTYGVTHVQASRAAVFQIVELLVAVVSAVLIGGETLSYGDYVGGALILLATMIEAFPRPSPSAEICSGGASCQQLAQRVTQCFIARIGIERAFEVSK